MSKNILQFSISELRSKIVIVVEGGFGKVKFLSF